MIKIETTEMISSITSSIEEKFNHLSKLFESKIMDNERPLTAVEAMNYLSISKSTLHRYVKLGLIHKFVLGDRVYYKKSQLDSSIKKVN